MDGVPDEGDVQYYPAPLTRGVGDTVGRRSSKDTPPLPNAIVYALSDLECEPRYFSK